LIAEVELAIVDDTDDDVDDTFAAGTLTADPLLATLVSAMTVSKYLINDPVMIDARTADAKKARPR
jgi:hypothetical protein